MNPLNFGLDFPIGALVLCGFGFSIILWLISRVIQIVYDVAAGRRASFRL